MSTLKERRRRVATMLRTGLFTLVLLLMSGCATFIGDEPGQAEQTGIDQSQNDQLRTEAAALRQAVQQQQDELDRLKADSSGSTY
jgi:hypothetical protein